MSKRKQSGVVSDPVKMLRVKATCNILGRAYICRACVDISDRYYQTFKSLALVVVVAVAVVAVAAVVVAVG
jgi:hypothetical protein